MRDAFCMSGCSFECVWCYCRRRGCEKLHVLYAGGDVVNDGRLGRVWVKFAGMRKPLWC